MDINLAKALVKLVNEYSGESEAELYEDYSGRGMYGNTTTAITGTTVEELLSLVLGVVIENDSYMLDEFNNMEIDLHRLTFRQDSLGRGTIIY